MSTNLSNFTLRPPVTADGAALHALVQQCPPLEANTGYAYLLIATHFSAASVVAEDGDGLAGFVAGYRLPSDPSVWFVWQVGVHARARGAGLGRALLKHVIERPDFTPVRFLEATIAPSNTSSRRLFRGLARDFAVPCEELPLFEAAHFGGGDHEPEALFRIGPFRQSPQQKENTKYE